MFLNVLSNTRKFNLDRNVNLLQYIFSAEARQLKEVRRLDSALRRGVNSYPRHEKVKSHTRR